MLTVRAAAAYHTAIIDARFAPRVGRQMRLDLRKLRFRQPTLVATHLCLLFGSRESRHYVRANTFMGPDPRRILDSVCPALLHWSRAKFWVAKQRRWLSGH